MYDKWMQEAIDEALKAKDEVPVGAVVVEDNKIIGRAHNRPIASNNPGAHAEILALARAGKTLGNYRMPNASLYVTLEPCAMCAGAIIHARVKTLIFGAYDKKTGACGTVINLPESEVSNHKLEIIGGVFESECSQILQDFFAKKRTS